MHYRARARTYQNGKIIAAKLDDLDEEAEKEKAAEAVDEGVRFSRNESYSTQIDQLIDGTFDNENSHIMVDDHTPDIFVQAGLSDKPILMTANKAKAAMGVEVKNKNLHEVSAETMKRLPKLLENPVMMMDSATKKGSAVVFVNATDVSGNPVLCAIKIDGRGNYNDIEIDSNVITSVYGKDTNPIGFIETAVNEGRMVYWNKKMSQELFESPGLQLPDNLKQLDSDVIIHRFGEYVNPESEKSDVRFSRSAQDSTDSAAQAEYHESTGQIEPKNTEKPDFPFFGKSGFLSSRFQFSSFGGTAKRSAPGKTRARNLLR